jgi:hypothetical protein
MTAASLEAEDQLPKLADDLWFPHHVQEHPMACGPACLRMIAEWVTGRLWKEKVVAERVGWRGHFRPSPTQRKTTLAFLSRIGADASFRFCYRGADPIDAPAEAVVRDLLDVGDPAPRGAARLRRIGDVGARAPAVAMLHIASYRCNARLAQTRQIPVNFGHWIVVRAIRKVSPDMDSEVRAHPPKKGRIVHLAVVDDPAFTEARFEPWESISGQVIDTALVVLKKKNR